MKSIYLTALFLLFIPCGRAAFVELDISPYYNYDGVATADEMSTNVPINGASLRDSLPGHSITNTRAYANQASVASGTALPDTGSLTGADRPYTISSSFDNGTDFLSSQSNMVRVHASNTTPTASTTLTFSGSEQLTYSDFNIAFVSHRASSASGYRTWVEANYTDSSSAIVLDTGTSDNGAFPDNLQQSSSAYSFTNLAPGTGQTIGITPVLTMDRLLSRAGTDNSIRSGTASVWEFDQSIGLDSTKNLESLTINLTRGGVNRDQSLFLLGITANSVPVIPEPGSLFLAAIALSCVLLIGKKRTS